MTFFSVTRKKEPYDWMRWGRKDKMFELFNRFNKCINKFQKNKVLTYFHL